LGLGFFVSEESGEMKSIIRSFLFVLITLLKTIGVIDSKETLCLPRVLIVATDWAPPTNELISTGLFDTVDFYEMGGGTHPPLLL
jgi:hypothetical protein